MEKIVNNEICSGCGKHKNDSYRFYKKIQLCGTCYSQLKKYGKINTNHRKSKNVINEYDDYCEISIRNHKGEIIAWSKIDKDMINIVNIYKWHKTKFGYAVSKEKERKLLHVFIFGEKEGYFIDHINRDKLDNRTINLRYVTKSQNNINKNMQSNNTSGRTGVYWDKSREKWVVYVSINGKSKYICRAENYEDACVERDKAELFYYGIYSPKYEELIEKYKNIRMGVE